MAKLTPWTKGFTPKTAKTTKDSNLAWGQASKKNRTHDGLASVVGSDGRMRERETDLVPWRMICALRIRTASGARFIGTGWFVGPSTVITAGHCIRTRRETAVEIEVIPGRDEDIHPYGILKVGADRMDVHPRWQSGFDPDRDVGVLHMPGEPGRETGWIAIAAAADADLEGRLVNVAGYPGTVHDRAANGRELWWHRDALGRVERERIHYLTDTTGGQSGGPVWSSNDQGGAPIAVGIHAYGTPGGQRFGPSAQNSSPRIDEALARRIADWIATSNNMADTQDRPAPSRTRLIKPPRKALISPHDHHPPTEAEVMAMLRDPEISMDGIRPYLREAPEASEAFAPRFEMAVPMQPGEVRPEGAFLLDSLNALVRAKRQWAYRVQARKRPGDLRLVSDGDSWFLHPLIEETWGHLFDTHLIYSVDGAGDLVSDIARAREALIHMRRTDAQGVMLSGGGNDMLSDGALALVLKKGSGSRPEAYFDARKFDRRLDKILTDFRAYIGAIRAAEPAAHVFLHGYDYARPMRRGKWLSRPMDGIVPDAVQARVVALFIDRLNEAMIDMAGALGDHVHHIDMRGAAPHPWYDEIHPADGGFGVVAARFDDAIREALRRVVPGHEIIAGATSSELHPLAAHMQQPLDDGAQSRARRRYVTRMLEAGREISMRNAADAAVEGRELVEERVILPPLPGGAGFAGFAPDAAVEVVLGERDFLPARFLRDGAERARAVCRIRRADGGSGTGTLLRGGYVLTNWHVLPDAGTAQGAVAQFGFEDGGTLITAPLMADRFCLTNAARDFAIIACDMSGLTGITPLRLPLAPAGLVEGARLNIIQHPAGRQKEVALRDNRLTRLLSGTLRYRTDTEPGSSGSAVFDDSWQIVGLHRAGAAGAFNEAIRIEAITGYLETQLVTGGPQSAPELRSFLAGSAPELGFFGRHGALAMDGAGGVAPEVELPGFSGDGIFADVGFWNIQDFFGTVSQDRVDRVAELLVSMNMDVMGLSEVSQDAIERTVEAMNTKGENAGFVYFNAGHARDLAIIYDRDTTTVTPMEAASERHKALIEARIDGKRIFPRKPLIAEVTVGEARFAMIVVHLKSQAGFNGALSRERRRLAANALRDIVSDIAANEGLPAVIGGDFNEDLGTDVLDGLTGTPDLLTLTANDHVDGAISYAGARHRSLIDHVVVSKDVKIADLAGDDLAIIRFDQSVPDFVGTLSDHVPLVMRLVMRTDPVDRASGAGGDGGAGGDARSDDGIAIEIPQDATTMIFN